MCYNETEVKNMVYARFTYNDRNKRVKMEISGHAASAPKANSQTFDKNASRSTSLHVPGASVESYKATMPWSTFASITPLPAENSEQQDM